MGEFKVPFESKVSEHEGLRPSVRRTLESAAKERARRFPGFKVEQYMLHPLPEGHPAQAFD